MRKLTCLILCLCLLASLPFCAGAEARVLRISSPEDLIRLAQDCRLDSYSLGLTVKLTRDLNMTGLPFEGIPIFSGTFEGGGYRISGLSLTHAGSHVGLFRYLTAEAVVRDLQAAGTVAPTGTKEYVGGIAGASAGRIENCAFAGTVSGSQHVGGIAGLQALTGVTENCTVSGTVQGTHFAGGIAGSSSGVIRGCVNNASVNTLLEQNKITLENITLDTLTGAESAATVTDIGGIAGTGTGVIRDCENRGNVGYPQIGYNIGGIVGSTCGYLYHCTNTGTVQGRKEVGGIAGQLEPAINILFSEDALQQLKDQMNGISGIASAMGSHAGSGVSALREQANRLEQEKENAREAVGMLAPSGEFPFLPDADTVQASKNALASSISGMNESVSAMATISKNTLNTLSNDVQNLAGQISAIGGTVATASDNLGASVADISGMDTPEDMTSKIQACRSEGPVSGDWNVGGIVGSIAIENDLDPESDLDLTGEYSLNFAMELRSVLVDCQSFGTVTGRKQNVGGIVGWMSMGLVNSCVCVGTVEASGSEYTGGIAGRSQGILRDCAYRGALKGSRYSGGIAGSGETVTGCKVIAELSGAGEFRGAILGTGNPEALVENFYLPVSTDPGAVDGISYAEKALALDQEAFFALPNMPHGFEIVTVTFRFADGTETRRVFPYGSRLSENQFPQLPTLEGAEGSWISPLAPEEPLCFDTVIEAVYEPHSYTLSVDTGDRDGLPLLLVQGDFLPGSTVTMTRRDTAALEAWDLELPESASPRKLRYRLPQALSSGQVTLLGLASGKWTELTCTVSGSYLVFEAPQGLTAIELRQAPTDNTPLYLAIAAGAALLLLTVTLSLLAKASRKRKAEQNAEC